MNAYESLESCRFVRLLAQSFAHWTGTELLPGASEMPDLALARAAYAAPFGLVAHGTQADPIFCYGNRLALELFEMDWPAFTALPSRLSAEAQAGIQDDRNRLMAEALKKGWVADYNGIRVSKTGRRFEIGDTILWNVVNAQGQRHGQAACIRMWRHLDSNQQ